MKGCPPCLSEGGEAIRLDRRIRWLGVLAVLFSVRPAPAQTVRGRLMEAITDQPVAYGTVALLTEEGETVASTTTGPKGSFRISASGRESGTYLLTAQALGYRSVTDGVFRLGPSDSITVAFRIEPAPVLLDSMVVEAEVDAAASEPDLVRNGFVQRMRRGFGEFVTPADLERWNPARLTEVFHRIPGVSIRYRFADDQLRMRAQTGGRCAPSLYVDGLRMSGESLSDLGLTVDAVKAVEVFRRPAEVPLEYGGTAMGGCGAVLFWTRP